jgi:hypothetical protein
MTVVYHIVQLLGVSYLCKSMRYYTLFPKCPQKPPNRSEHYPHLNGIRSGRTGDLGMHLTGFSSHLGSRQAIFQCYGINP